MQKSYLATFDLEHVRLINELQNINAEPLNMNNMTNKGTLLLNKGWKMNN